MVCLFPLGLTNESTKMDKHAPNIANRSDKATMCVILVSPTFIRIFCAEVQLIRLDCLDYVGINCNSCSTF